MDAAWPYRSHEDLLRAGFRCRGRITCPICERGIVIYQILDRMPVFVNSWDFQPHLDLRHTDHAERDYVDQKCAAAGDRT